MLVAMKKVYMYIIILEVSLIVLSLHSSSCKKKSSEWTVIKFHTFNWSFSILVVPVSSGSLWHCPYTLLLFLKVFEFIYIQSTWMQTRKALYSICDVPCEVPLWQSLLSKMSHVCMCKLLLEVFCHSNSIYNFMVGVWDTLHISHFKVQI